jgi:hypothetical protein
MAAGARACPLLPADRAALAAWLAAPCGGVAAGWARWGPLVLAWLRQARPALATVVAAAAGPGQ